MTISSICTTVAFSAPETTTQIYWPLSREFGDSLQGCRDAYSLDLRRIAHKGRKEIHDRFWLNLHTFYGHDNMNDCFYKVRLVVLVFGATS